MKTEAASDHASPSSLERAVTARDRLAVSAAVQAMLAQGASTRQLSAILRIVDGPMRESLGLRPIRIALLSSFSIEFVHDSLRCQCLAAGIDAHIYQAGFAQYRQEILDPGSGLHAFEPDLTILAVDGNEWMRGIYDAYASLSETEARQTVDDGLADVRGLVQAFSARITGLLAIHNLDGVRHPTLGFVDGKFGFGQAEAIGRFNLGLIELSRATPNLFVIDYAGLVAELGRERWLDLRLAHLAQAPLSTAALLRLAGAYAHVARAKLGLSRKCLVVDLDNTLWGGVVGEDGVEGLSLGPNYPGSAYLDFQRGMLDLGRRGVLLAIASKNNEGDAWEVFDRHPHMALKREHFAASRINWDPKSDSLRSIAEELNIGLDQIVFVDDNPAECAQVKEALPMVEVVQLPGSPESFRHVLSTHRFFDTLTYTDEDRRRAELYRQRREAEALRQGAGSLESYYRGLQMTVAIEPLSTATAARAAQMTQKTNQFNATTRRYTEAELLSKSESQDWLALTVRVTDRYGDHGIVGLMLARDEDHALGIDTFLLSCRVIGRTVESAMLHVLCAEALARGHARVIGRIIPTAKNVPVRDLFSRHGFTGTSGDATSDSTWELCMTDGSGVACPPWLRLETPATV